MAAKQTKRRKKQTRGRAEGRGTRAAIIRAAGSKQWPFISKQRLAAEAKKDGIIMCGKENGREEKGKLGKRMLEKGG